MLDLFMITDLMSPRWNQWLQRCARFHYYLNLFPFSVVNNWYSELVPCNQHITLSMLFQPHSPDNRALARECKDVKIDRVYIGSCTGGKTEDFLAAAKIFLASVSSGDHVLVNLVYLAEVLVVVCQFVPPKLKQFHVNLSDICIDI